MHRCGSGFLLTLVITFAVVLSGCLGKSSNNGENESVRSVSLNPSGNFSMDIGHTQVFTATATNSSGGTVLNQTIQYVVASGSPNVSAPLSIASNGNACAGTWDASIAICSPGTSGIALVTAVIDGVSSPVTTVYVHQHIDNIQISRLDPQGPPLYDCFSQGQTWGYQATAYSNNVDITGTIGPLSWTSSNSEVVTAIPSVPPNQPNVLNQVQTTAKNPGITQLFATVSGTTSTPYPYTTCLVKAIYLQIGGQGQAGDSITVKSGDSVPITAIAVDTLYGIANSTPLTNPPLTWSTTNPEVAGFSSSATVTGNNTAMARSNLGGASVFASCTPPTCNIGVLPGLPIYASNGVLLNNAKGYGAISIDVTSTSNPPTYTAWAATTGCQDALGCSSAMFAVTPGNTPLGSIVSLPRTPNSMMFNHQSGPRVYLGSDQGLMYVDVAGNSTTASLVSNSPTPCNVAVCGKVLTISNDGKLVVVSDTVSTPSQVYIYNGSGGTVPPVDLIIPGETATAAAFSPDQLKLFILTSTGNMYVYSTVDALTSVPIATSVTDVKFSADGSFAYVAGTPAPGSAISGFATCNQQATLADPSTSPNFNFVTTPGIPTQIFPSPDLQHVIALDPTQGAIDVFTTVDNQISLPYNRFTCLAPTVNFPQTAQSFDLGQPKGFLPVYSDLVADGTEVILVARKIPAVILFNVNGGSTTSVPLVGSPDPLSATASTDGSQVFVAACDQYAQDGTTCAVGSIHVVCTSTCAAGQGDFQQVPFVNPNDNNNRNMCSNGGNPTPQCLPDLVAISPK